MWWPLPENKYLCKYLQNIIQIWDELLLQYWRKVFNKICFIHLYNKSDFLFYSKYAKFYNIVHRPGFLNRLSRLPPKAENCPRAANFNLFLRSHLRKIFFLFDKFLIYLVCSKILHWHVVTLVVIFKLSQITNYATHLSH